MAGSGSLCVFHHSAAGLCSVAWPWKRRRAATPTGEGGGEGVGEADGAREGACSAGAGEFGRVDGGEGRWEGGAESGSGAGAGVHNRHLERRQIHKFGWRKPRTALHHSWTVAREVVLVKDGVLRNNRLSGHWIVEQPALVL
ncbi:hypothetical protein B0H17DRAFT_1131680 [Mycena rosella]|uniref:Uncharacterized protein n=1 Tax=Mycena rosella TaxID=1033263 RepID=A0AAD7GHN2_MYCRO|nr:hypothetical protein B0H17DRAFT_1131680 [Mycena rosella]